MRKVQYVLYKRIGGSRYEILLAVALCCCGHATGCWLALPSVGDRTHTRRDRGREKVKTSWKKVKKNFWKKSIRFGKKSKKTFGKSQYVLEKSQYVLEKSQKKLLEKVNTFWKKSQGMNSQKTAGVLACSENRRPLLERVCLPGAK
jgi:hypothetical protein